MPPLRLLLRNYVAFAFTLFATVAAAQMYPSKPVRLIIPFPPGGSNDIVGRMAAAQLGERLGQPVIVDNRPGAGSTIGTEAAAKSPPDGHTLLLIAPAYVFSPSIYKKLPYDPAAAFVPVAILGTGPAVLVVHPSLPVYSVQDLIALAKEKPGRLNWTVAGVGTFQHLASLLFKLQAGIEVVHVQYKGGGPATTDLIAGHADVSMGSVIQMLPHIRGGKLRALGTTGAARNVVLPDVPTIAEAGVAGHEASIWWGIVAPAGTPQPIVDRLNTDLSMIALSAETKKRFQAEGAEARRMTPSEFGKFIADETAKWAWVVKVAGISAE